MHPAGVAGELAAGADDAMAGDDDRDRVGAEGSARGPRGLRVAGGRGDLAVGRGLAEGDARGRLQDAAAELRVQRPVDRDVEVRPLVVEVLVELAAHRVEPGGLLEDARAEPTGEVLEDGVEAAVEVL